MASNQVSRQELKATYCAQWSVAHGEIVGNDFQPSAVDCMALPAIAALTPSFLKHLTLLYLENVKPLTYMAAENCKCAMVLPSEFQEDHQNGCAKSKNKIAGSSGVFFLY